MKAIKVIECSILREIGEAVDDPGRGSVAYRVEVLIRLSIDFSSLRVAVHLCIALEPMLWGRRSHMLMEETQRMLASLTMTNLSRQAIVFRSVWG